MSDQRTPHHMVVQGRNSPTSNPDTSQSEIRMVMTGGRQLMGVEASGKSSAGNIILGRNAFDTSRRTARSVQSTGNVHGRRLTVVDTPGWWWHYSVEITPKFDRRELIRSPTLCLPGPHAFLLVIPVDLAFPSVYRITLEQQLKFLSKEVWRHIIVLFTSTEPACDESSLKSKIRKWPDLEQLLKRCHNRYHILNINNKSDNTQVITLLEKIEKMVAQNNGHHFKIGRNIYVAGEREKETRERANQRVLAVKRQRSELRARFRDGPQHLTDVRIVILGAAWAARSSAGNILLGEEAFKVDDSRTTVCCETYNKVLEEHMDILGKKVWNHTIVLFTRGDWLGDTSIEERIENEGKQLQWLIRKCGNRYHVFNCKQHTDNTQVLELLAKIEEMVMENNGCHFVPETDSNPSTELELKMKIANRKMMKVRRQRDILQELLKERKHNLSDVRIVLLGGEGVGKSTSGNVILQANVFKNMQGENCKVKKKIRQCVMQQRKVEEWHVSVVDTPGWSSSALENAKEIAQSVTICSPGPHVFLLVLPAHQSFTQTAQQTVEQLMSLFGKGIFRHTIILFTGGRWLRDRPVEHYTACEEEALQKLIARCGNRYHMLSDKGSKYQVKKLLKLIEEMVRRNRGEYFTPEKKDIKPLPTVLQLLNESNTMRDEWNKREDELIDKMLKAAVVDLDGEESEQPSYRRRESISQSTAASEDSLSESGISIGAETLSPVAKVCSWLEHFTNNGASLVTSSTIQDLNMESATDDLLIFKHNASDMAKYLSKIRERKHGRSLSF
ncbi:GTPase IMAP family member 8-like isoform X2 [Triplophysa dalaica]|uniref:GTPase IMAP family member 8-like isoform X2 n=1 Tax=Triplophysa dalaica TaxID=1582913 RepID=UPI0024DFDDAD|nr:GTPase IMAP family member 8-like isoform X2 [Triplophysa dalaica]